MANQEPRADTQQATAKSGPDMEPGSVPRYLLAIAVMVIIAIVWAVVWETVFAKYHHADIGWVNIFVGFAIGTVMRKVWGIGGGIAALNAVILMLFSLGLGHLLLFEHYSLMQQAADDIGNSPSFRSLMGHMTVMHWVWCASSMIGALWMPLKSR